MRSKHLLIAGLAVLAITGATRADWVPLGPDGGYLQGMAMSPQDPDVMYAAVYDYPNTFSRVMKTTDGGESWECIGQIEYRYIYGMEVDPFDPDRAYACIRSTSIYRTTDGGATWTPSVLPYAGYMVKADPFVEGRLYVSGYYYDVSTYKMTMYISTDHGATWTPSVADTVGSSYAYCCAVSPVDSGVVYIAGSGGKLYKSTDWGQTWQLRNSGLGTNNVFSISENPGNRDILIAGTTSRGVYRSTDAGLSWAQTGRMLRAYYTAFSTANPAYGYAAYDTVFVTTDSGATWFQPDPGIKHTYAKGFAVHPTDPDVAFVCGTNGCHRTEDHGTNWTEAHTGMRIAQISTISVNPENQNRSYLELYQNGVYSSLDCGETWTRCSDFLSCGNICGIGVEPGADADVLYALEGSG